MINLGNKHEFALCLVLIAGCNEIFDIEKPSEIDTVFNECPRGCPDDSECTETGCKKKATSGNSAGQGGQGGATVGGFAGNIGGACKKIKSQNPSNTADKAYPVTINGETVLVNCLMSADGGGWTMVANFPKTHSVPGWNGPDRVGTSFVDTNFPFKLSDEEINSLRTYGFRVRGTATVCGIPQNSSKTQCSLDVTLFWKAKCKYSGKTESPDCATAYFDVDFLKPTGNTQPCNQHFGLTDTLCGVRGGIVSSHNGNEVVVGNPYSYTHSFSGRSGENPSIQIWVR